MLIREAQISDASQIAIVAVDTWRTTYDGVMADDYLEKLSYAGSEARWTETILKQDNFTFVAEAADGRITGYACAGPEREGYKAYPAELYALYVLKDYQGVGIGRQLVKTVARRFVILGIHSMLIWVLAANPSRGFYERLGGQEFARKFIRIGGRDLEEIAFVWDDIREFI